MTALGFLKLTPSVLGHEVINHSSRPTSGTVFSDGRLRGGLIGRDPD